jgi:thiol-disulfide isomerase/thioredoxin
MSKSLILKFGFILAIIIATISYAIWEKQKYFSHEEDSSSLLVLKELPSFTVYSLDSQKITVNLNTLSNTSGMFVHLWGTWCGPCEHEMPAFLIFADKVKSKGIKFYLIAVGDEVANVKKFLKKFPVVPENVVIAIDLDNTIMDLFGTLKVPETFLFNSSGKHVNKFVGPQEWSQESYISRLDFLLNSKK